MIHTFATREEAAIYASAMRSEGHFAEVLDEGMGAIYGPLAIGGIRVLASDEPFDDALDPAEAGELGGGHLSAGEAAGGEFQRGLRLFVVSLVAFGLLVGLLLPLATETPRGAATMLFHSLKIPLVLALSFVLLGPLMAGFTRLLRGEQESGAARVIRWLLLAALIPLLLLAAL